MDRCKKKNPKKEKRDKAKDKPGERGGQFKRNAGSEAKRRKERQSKYIDFNKQSGNGGRARTQKRGELMGKVRKLAKPRKKREHAAGKL